MKVKNSSQIITLLYSNPTLLQPTVDDQRSRISLSSYLSVGSRFTSQKKIVTIFSTWGSGLVVCQFLTDAGGRENKMLVRDGYVVHSTINPSEFKPGAYNL